MGGEGSDGAEYDRLPFQPFAEGAERALWLWGWKQPGLTLWAHRLRAALSLGYLQLSHGGWKLEEAPFPYLELSLLLQIPSRDRVAGAGLWEASAKWNQWLEPGWECVSEAHVPGGMWCKKDLPFFFFSAAKIRKRIKHTFLIKNCINRDRLWKNMYSGMFIKHVIFSVFIQLTV